MNKYKRKSMTASKGRKIKKHSCEKPNTREINLCASQQPQFQKIHPKEEGKGCKVAPAWQDMHPLGTLPKQSWKGAWREPSKRHSAPADSDMHRALELNPAPAEVNRWADLVLLTLMFMFFWSSSSQRRTHCPAHTTPNGCDSPVKVPALLLFVHRSQVSTYSTRLQNSPKVKPFFFFFPNLSSQRDTCRADELRKHPAHKAIFHYYCATFGRCSEFCNFHIK